MRFTCRRGRSPCKLSGAVSSHSAVRTQWILLTSNSESSTRMSCHRRRHLCYCLPGQPPADHPGTLEEVRSLWIGDLQYWIDENYLLTCFCQAGEIFVGCLDLNITEEELKQISVQFGEIICVKIQYGKRMWLCAICSEEAIHKLHGTMIGQQIVRLSWGKSPASKQLEFGKRLIYYWLNAQYLAVHGNAMLGRHLWLKTSLPPELLEVYQS
ncbi:hypothetical protein ZIOFF_000012 [Zingiber officinale]|uniref:RRM domain-containing protein n=1 Tax=Zingiber officinale TaxID=94328 RepID=A0A8J5IIX6_ZINOF|nr:hypothetical protein ZIOFF_000012 [Zingiber officinale]